MPWARYSAVRFTTDDYREDGAPIGAKGYIVEVYDDAYEVEVSDQASGETLFLGAVPGDRLRLLDEA